MMSVDMVRTDAEGDDGTQRLFDTAPNRSWRPNLNAFFADKLAKIFALLLGVIFTPLVWVELGLNKIARALVEDNKTPIPSFLEVLVAMIIDFPLTSLPGFLWDYLLIRDEEEKETGAVHSALFKARMKIIEGSMFLQIIDGFLTIILMLVVGFVLTLAKIVQAFVQWTLGLLLLGNTKGSGQGIFSFIQSVALTTGMRVGGTVGFIIGFALDLLKGPFEWFSSVRAVFAKQSAEDELTEEEKASSSERRAFDIMCHDTPPVRFANVISTARNTNNKMQALLDSTFNRRKLGT